MRTTTPLRVEATTPAHVACMTVRLGEQAMDLGRAWTFLLDDEPLCCFGLSTLWSGVGLAWFLERDPARTQPYRMRIARMILAWWRVWANEFRYVEALVMADRDDSRRLIEWLGFVPLVTKEGYGPGGETMIEYAWRGAHGS